ncbi:shikimate kinase [Staphylococcus lugdunensis]|uniref:shikimate kinase n=1 Tax=Staphylococcus lugdunensis TaxID=28035 RepID=UPI001F4D0E35|nr:shikimate kinase [Staphylococcus lugdunensis]MCH8645850.1 shikimate kinase [Staphylococcus lugdunensis]
MTLFNFTKPIIFIGFMGTGKSTLAQFMAQKLTLSFVDLDQFIEINEQQSIPEIFATRGEQHFRELEYHYLKEALQQFDIIATGGGIIENVASFHYLKTQQNVIWLDCDIDIIYQRIVNDSHRPNAKSKTKSQLKSLYLTRVSRYNEIAFIKVNSSFSIQQLYEEIINSINRD